MGLKMIRGLNAELVLSFWGGFMTDELSVTVAERHGGASTVDLTIPQVRELINELEKHLNIMIKDKEKNQ